MRKHESKDGKKEQLFLSRENAEQVILHHLNRQKSMERIKKSISPTPTPVPSPSEEEIVFGDVIPSRACDVKQLLSTTCVENVLASGGNIITLQENDTVQHALQTFRSNELQSAPVYSGDRFLDLLNTSDILSFFCSLDHNASAMKNDFLQKKLKDLIGVSKSSPTPAVPIGTPLSEVVKILAKGDAHRVEVLDERTQSVFNIVSQLSIAQYVAKNISLLTPVQRNKPVSELMNWMARVLTIPSDTKTYKAFGYLYNDGISAAAVVDLISGNLIDTISTSDLVGLIDEGYDYLNSSIVEFLSATRRTKALKPPITCHLSDTLEYVLIKLASTKVHRLWVTDESSNRYLGVVNLTSVLEALREYLMEDSGDDDDL